MYNPQALMDMKADDEWISYDDVVESFGYKYELALEMGSYEGDYVYLLSDGLKRGFLMFGYGSCSGCDALEGCITPNDIRDLANSLHGNIRWFDSTYTRNAFIRDSVDDPNHWFSSEEEYKTWASDYLHGRDVIVWK